MKRLIFILLCICLPLTVFAQQSEPREVTREERYEMMLRNNALMKKQLRGEDITAEEMIQTLDDIDAMLGHLEKRRKAREEREAKNR